jgi:hypothetical protein
VTALPLGALSKAFSLASSLNPPSSAEQTFTKSNFSFLSARKYSWIFALAGNSQGNLANIFHVDTLLLSDMTNKKAEQKHCTRSESCMFMEIDRRIYRKGWRVSSKPASAAPELESAFIAMFNKSQDCWNLPPPDDFALMLLTNNAWNQLP